MYATGRAGQVAIAPQMRPIERMPSERRILETLKGVRAECTASGRPVSMADLIVLGGCAAVEAAARNAGHDITVPFTPGRTDASPEQTDAESLAVTDPTVVSSRRGPRP